ncbi:MAG: hypothetical protein NT049_17935 [Planctomycetota bacterium]|nr:hypothetical protein [Planctomycetota bacterium]
MLRRVLLAAAAVVLAVSAWFALEVYTYFANIVLPWHRQEAINATCDMGGLAPFPDSATVLSVITRGNLFTREFEISFRAPAADIKAWISQSPRLRDHPSPMPDPDTCRRQVRRPARGRPRRDPPGRAEVHRATRAAMSATIAR